jgi:hypothetical protein
VKHYITRAGKPDFVCQARTTADAIVSLWLATREIPQASYRVHQGRRRKARTVSSAVTFWRIHTDLREPLYDILQEVSSKKQFDDFCTNVTTIGKILGY